MSLIEEIERDLLKLAKEEEMKNYPTCSHCDAEINPNLWDGCEKYYNVGGEIYCAECFKEWVLEWIETDLDEVARVLEVPVVEVR